MTGHSPVYVLNNIFLEIPKNKVTAIVGASGSGKTTLLKLLLGYYMPDEGKINIGSTAFEEVNLSVVAYDLRSSHAGRLPVFRYHCA